MLRYNGREHKSDMLRYFKICLDTLYDCMHIYILVTTIAILIIIIIIKILLIRIVKKYRDLC